MDGGGIDLNSQAEAFPALGLYGALLQGDADGILPGGGRGRGSGLPPYRPPRAREADGWVTPLAHQLNFGSSSSAAAGRGGGNGGVFLGGSSTAASGGVRQRANSAAAAPRCRNQRTSMANHRGGGGQRVPRPRAPRSAAIRGQSSGSHVPFADGDQEMEDEVEELASSGGLPVSQTNRAQWNDANNACLLELCLEQRAAGTYNGATMSGDGYQAVVDGLHTVAQRLYRLVSSRTPEQSIFEGESQQSSLSRCI
ncbi:unnamed protein product [Urochloa humidicola]